MQIVVEPLSRNNLIDIKTGLTVGERGKVEETPDDDGENAASDGPHTQKVLVGDSLTDGLAGLALLVLCDGRVAGLELVEIDGLNVEDEF